MTFRDLAEAVGTLYGEKNYGMHTVRASDLARPLDADDLAAAWIRGDRDKVLHAVAVHEAKVRARPVIVKLDCKKHRILILRKRGWSTIQIAKAVGSTSVYVARTCRKFGFPVTPSRANRANISRLRMLRRAGMKLREIAEKEGLSKWTVCRLLRTP